MTNVDELFGDIEMGTVISCPVCREVYNLAERSPINIPCGHTICSQCSSALVPRHTQPVLMCPVCRKRHYGQNNGGAYTFNFPKNYQLLEVVEKVARLKEKQDKARADLCFVNCRDCKKQFSEDLCTQCICVKDPASEDLDFMERPKNHLICSDCINATHLTHDVKPMAAVKAAYDNMVIMKDLKTVADLIRGKSEATRRALDNCTDELDTISGLIEKCLVRLNGKPKDANLYCLTAKFLKKLQTFEKNVESVRSSAHFHATNLGGLADFIRNFGVQTRPQPVLSATGAQNTLRPQGAAPEPVPDVQEPQELPQQQQPEQQQQPPQNPAQVRLVDGENIQIGDGANVNIMIHVADEQEREGRVREIMNRFGAGAAGAAGAGVGDPDIIAFGNNEGVAGLRIVNGRQHEQVLNGLLRGVFDFLDQVAVEPGPRNDVNNHGRDPHHENPVVDEIAIFDRDLLENGQMAALNVQRRRRVQIRLRLEHQEAAVNNQPGAEIEDNAPDAGVMIAEEEEAPVQPARRRGRPRRAEPVAQEPEEPMVVEENDDEDEAIAIRRPRRRNQPRHDPIQRAPRGNTRNRRTRR